MRSVGGAIFVLALTCVFIVAPSLRADDALPAGANKMCPVMTDQPTRADRFIDYQGKRIYFCCEKCMAKFQLAPAKYLANLNGGGPVTAATNASVTQVPQPLGKKWFEKPIWQLFGRFHVVIVHFPDRADHSRRPDRAAETSQIDAQ